MIGVTLIGIGTWLVTRGFDYTFITDYFYALLYILPGILAVFHLEKSATLMILETVWCGHGLVVPGALPRLP